MPGPSVYYQRLDAIEAALAALDNVRQVLQGYDDALNNLKIWQTRYFRQVPLDVAYIPTTQPYLRALENHAQIAQIKLARLRLNEKMQTLEGSLYNPQLVEDIQESVNYLHAQHCTGHPNEYLIDEYRAWLVLNDEYKADY